MRVLVSVVCAGVVLCSLAPTAAAQILPEEPEPGVINPPFGLPRLGTAGPGGGGAVLLVDEALGSRLENPARLLTAGRWSLSAGYAYAEERARDEYMVEGSARRGSAAFGVGTGRRQLRDIVLSFEPGGGSSESFDLEEDIFQAGAAVALLDERVALGATAGARRSRHFEERGVGYTWNAAIAVRPFRLLRLSAATLETAVRTRWRQAGAERTTEAERLLAVGAELPGGVLRVRGVGLSGGAEYTRRFIDEDAGAYAATGDRIWRFAGAASGLGPVALRATVEQRWFGGDREWVASAGVSLTARRFALGLGNRFDADGFFGDVRTVNVGYVER